MIVGLPWKVVWDLYTFLGNCPPMYFLVCKGDKKKKKKCGSGSSISSNSRSSTPTIAKDGATNTIAATATKVNQDRPGIDSL